MELTTLTEEDIQHFYDHGYVKIPGAIDRAFCDEAVAFGFKRLGYDPNDPTTWDKDIIHMPIYNKWPVKEIAPRAWGAICDLMGGEARIADSDYPFDDRFIVNVRWGTENEWQPPTQTSRGWHVDGDHFLHFLDSPEQALLIIVIWKDIEHQGGGTFMAPDSIAPVAKLLAAHPEGLEPGDPLWRDIPGQCNEFVEVTAKAGDVFLLNPFMLHASSPNHSGTPRFMTNPYLGLKEPLNFNRENPDDFSIVERSILKALGVDRLDYQITSERRNIVPARIEKQRKMLEEEKARIASEQSGD